MTFFPEDRASELRELFFESAQELLQALNEEGLLLERRPGDAEIVRNVRRTVHTLKGDSAACGFREFSELAHQLEDVLTPELAATAGAAFPELVLSAADMFDAMLAAYRSDMPLPSAEPLHALMDRLTRTGAPPPEAAFTPEFAWNEYEQLVITQGAAPGQYLYNVAIEIDPHCPMHAAAVQLVRNMLQEAGTLLAMHPDENAASEQVERVEAAMASEHDQEWIEKRCHIPSVVRRVLVEVLEESQQPAGTEEAREAPPEEPSEQHALGMAEDEAAQEWRAVHHEAASVMAAQVIEHESAQAQAVAAPAVAAVENMLRVDAERIDAVLNLVGEMIIGKSMLQQSVGEFAKRFPKDPLRSRFGDAMAFQARVLNELQRSVMKIRMVPVEQLFRRFPRIARDVAKMRGKEVEVVMTGQNTDLDKSILDTLAEPISHMVRNAVDHGIETPEERVAAGKPGKGKLRLDAYHQGNQVVIEISDDGRGIDRERILAKAIERGVISAGKAAKLTEAQALELIFEPGFSTAAEVTEISGRGVGMDVVKSVMERVKGSVSIDTRPGEGTRFLLKVPLTLAIMKALLFRVADRLYAVPLAAVLEITRAREADIHCVDNHEVVQTRDQVLTLIRLSHLARTPAPSASKVFIVVISIASRRFGLIVDRLVGEDELVIKALDNHLVATELVSGASILGDGTVVLILNLSAVIERLGKMRLRSFADELSAGVLADAVRSSEQVTGAQA